MLFISKGLPNGDLRLGSFYYPKSLSPRRRPGPNYFTASESYKNLDTGCAGKTGFLEVPIDNKAQCSWRRWRRSESLSQGALVHPGYV